MNKQVVFIEWSSKGRDFEIDLPLMYFFENVLKWDVKYISIFNIPKILSTNPDIVIMSNTTGADINYNIAKIIKDSEILFFSHVSEGLFRESNLDGFLWGWNNKKNFNEELSMLWSIQSYNMSIKKYPYLKNQLRISGSLGHDKYKLFTINKIKTKYKKVIGYAAFDFEYGFINKQTSIEKNGINWYNLNQSYKNIINKIFKTIIKSNQDVLFVLKNHPGSGSKLSLELNNLDSFKNVMIISNEYSIVDIIAITDIWLNYRSSINLEAWLLNKPSISFCMDNCLLEHTKICYGSILENNANKIQNYIDEFYQTGTIKKFEAKKELREKLIKNYIGFSDGLNHIRFMSFLKLYIEKIENNQIKKGKWNISFKDKIKGYIKHIVYMLSSNRYSVPYINKWAFVYGNFKDDEVKKQLKFRYSDFDKFYKKNKEKIDDLYRHYAKNWKKELNIE
jgi:hypothetical protein